MESIKELRKICQTPKDIHNYEGLFNYFRVRIWRVPSIYVTKLFLYTPITANQVTMLMIFLGFVISFLFSFGSYWYSVAAAILIEVVYLLDAVDGEVARYKKQPSITGVFLDIILHLANMAVPFIGITIGVYRMNPGLDVVALGLLATLFTLANLDIQPLKHHALFMELIHYAKGEKRYKPKEQNEVKEYIKPKKENLLKKVFKTVINPFYDNFLMGNIIFAATVFNKLYWVLVFYGLTFPVIWLIKLVYEYKAGYAGYEYLLKPYKK